MDSTRDSLGRENLREEKGGRRKKSNTTTGVFHAYTNCNSKDLGSILPLVNTSKRQSRKTYFNTNYPNHQQKSRGSFENNKTTEHTTVKHPSRISSPKTQNYYESRTNNVVYFFVNKDCCNCRCWSMWFVVGNQIIRKTQLQHPYSRKEK